MPLVETVNHTFKTPWATAAYASWFKYPNPQRPDVLSVDIIQKKFDPETGILTATRVTLIKSSVPRWLLKFTSGCDTMAMVEHSMVDPKNQKMVLVSRNFTFQNMIELQERCVYTPNSTKLWTHFHQTAKATAFPYGVSSYIERFFVDRFKQNASLGREIMEFTIQKVKETFGDVQS